MNKTIALKLMRFSRTPAGQKLRFKVKNSYPWIWQKVYLRTRNKIAGSPLSFAFNKVSEHTQSVRSFEEFKEMVLGKDLELSVFKKSRGVQIYTPDFPLGSHTISELAFAQAEWLGGVVKTKVICAPYVDDKPSESITKLHFYDEPSVSHGVSIFHLGNNPQSTYVLHELLLSNRSQSIVILHDLNLVTLFFSYGNYQNIPHLIWDLAEDKYGSFGVIHLRRLLDGEDLPIEIKTMIFGIYVEVVSKVAKRIILHNLRIPIIEVLPSEVRNKISIIELPSRYVRSFSEQHAKIKTEDSHSLVIISGSNSPDKKIGLILQSLLLCLEKGLNFKIRVIGPIKLGVQEAMFKTPEFEKLGGIMDFHEAKENLEWITLHKKNSLGIRLNVGSNGESSGLVRDYLMFQMKVISDESSPSLQKQPRFYIADSDCDATSLAQLIERALHDTEVDTVRQFESEGNTPYLNLLKDSLQESLGKL